MALVDAKAKIESIDFDVLALSTQFMFNQPYCIDLIHLAKRLWL
jgi:hypothetical protein